MGQRLMGMMGRRQPQMQQPFQGGQTGGNMWRGGIQSPLNQQGAAGGNMSWGGNGWTPPPQQPRNNYQYNPIPGTTWDPPEWNASGTPPLGSAPARGASSPPIDMPAPTGGGPGMAGDIPLNEMGRGTQSPLASMPVPGGGGPGMAGDIPTGELGGPSPLQLAQALRGGPMNPALANMGTTGGNMWQPGMPTPGINPPRLMDVPRPNGRGAGLMPPGGWQ